MSTNRSLYLRRTWRFTISIIIIWKNALGEAYSSTPATREGDSSRGRWTLLRLLRHGIKLMHCHLTVARLSQFLSSSAVQCSNAHVQVRVRRSHVPLWCNQHFVYYIVRLPNRMHSRARTLVQCRDCVKCIKLRETNPLGVRYFVLKITNLWYGAISAEHTVRREPVCRFVMSRKSIILCGNLL